MQLTVRRRDRRVLHPGTHRAWVDAAGPPQAGCGVSQVVQAAALPGHGPPQRPERCRAVQPRAPPVVTKGRTGPSPRRTGVSAPRLVLRRVSTADLVASNVGI